MQFNSNTILINSKYKDHTSNGYRVNTDLHCYLVFIVFNKIECLYFHSSTIKMSLCLKVDPKHMRCSMLIHTILKTSIVPTTNFQNCRIFGKARCIKNRVWSKFSVLIIVHHIKTLQKLVKNWAAFDPELNEWYWLKGIKPYT